jgi:hypothetical protein
MRASSIRMLAHHGQYLADTLLATDAGVYDRDPPCSEEEFVALTKDYKKILVELRRQGWLVEQTTAGHWRATPPDPLAGLVHLSSGAETHAIHNVLRDLRQRGFIWPPPSKNELRAQRIDDVEEVEEEETMQAVETALPTPAPAIERAPIPTDELLEQYFSQLKAAKQFALQTERELHDAEEMVRESIAARDAAQEKNAQAQVALAKSKKDFDLVFGAKL